MSAAKTWRTPGRRAGNGCLSASAVPGFMWARLWGACCNMGCGCRRLRGGFRSTDCFCSRWFLSVFIGCRRTTGCARPPECSLAWVSLVFCVSAALAGRLLNHRLATCQFRQVRRGWEFFTACRLPVGDTADCQSALRLVAVQPDGSPGVVRNPKLKVLDFISSPARYPC